MMKKFALLLLAPPLAACDGGSVYHADMMTRFVVPSSPDAPLPGQERAAPLRQQQLAQAQTDCETRGIEPSIGDAGSAYWHCVNAYLWPHYGWVAALNPDGSLHVIVHRAGYRPGYFF